MEMDLAWKRSCTENILVQPWIFSLYCPQTTTVCKLFARYAHDACCQSAPVAPKIMLRTRIYGVSATPHNSSSLVKSLPKSASNPVWFWKFALVSTTKQQHHLMSSSFVVTSWTHASSETCPQCTDHNKVMCMEPTVVQTRTLHSVVFHYWSLRYFGGRFFVALFVLTVWIPLGAVILTSAPAFSSTRVVFCRFSCVLPFGGTEMQRKE